MVDALMHSCDVYYYDLAMKVGIDRISAMAIRLGLGSTLLDALPGERAGLVPTRGLEALPRSASAGSGARP